MYCANFGRTWAHENSIIPPPLKWLPRACPQTWLVQGHSGVSLTFDLVGILRTTCVLRTTCIFSDVIEGLTVWWYNKPKTKNPKSGSRKKKRNQGPLREFCLIQLGAVSGRPWAIVVHHLYTFLPLAVTGLLTVWWCNKPKTKNLPIHCWKRIFYRI